MQGKKFIYISLLLYIFFGSIAEAQVGSKILNPAPNSTIDTTSIRFEWEDTGALFYGLTVYQNDTSQAGNKLFFKGNITNTYQIVDNIPLDGGTLTVYLVSAYKYNQYNNYYQRLQTFTFNKIKDPNTPAPVTASKILSPVEGSTVTTSAITFDWEDVGATEYNLRIGTRLRAGSVRGSGVLYIASFPGNTTSKTISNLLSGSGNLYAELSSKINGRWYRSVSSYKRNIQDGPAISNLISPTDGSTLESSTQTFTWEDVGAKEYSLSVQDFNGNTIYNEILPGTITSKTVTNLPNDGHEVRLSLATKYHRFFAGSNNYAFTSFTDLSALRSEIISPANNATLHSQEQLFYWKDIPAATEYHLSIGTYPGGTDLYNASQGLNTSKMITNLPKDGKKIFIRISSKIDNTWRHSDSTVIAYKAPKSVNKKSKITSPVNGSTLSSSTVTFEWQDIGAAAYYLRVGTTKGWRNIIYRGRLSGNKTAKTIRNIPTNGETIYVRLYSRKNRRWKFNDYKYTTHQQ